MSQSLVAQIFNNSDTEAIINSIDQDNINEKFGPSGVTPLIAAARKNDLTLVQELIEEGADCNLTDNMGNTPLLIACTFANDLEIIKALLHGNANPNIRNKRKLVPIHAALLSENRINPANGQLVSNREEAVRELLLYNAKVTYVNDFNMVERISRIARTAGIGIGEKTTEILSSNGLLKYE